MRPSKISWWLSISCLPPLFTWLIWEENLHFSSHFPVGGFWLSSMTINYECKQKVPHYSRCVSTHLLPHRFVAHCGSHLIIFISNKSHLSMIPRKRVSYLFQLGCKFAIQMPSWLSKVAYMLSLAVFGCCTHSPVSPPDHHKSHLT
jgi:hypothetical protein